MQHFLDYDPETEERRAKPLDNNLLGPAGQSLACRFLRWVGDNMGKWKYQRKAPELVGLAACLLACLLMSHLWATCVFKQLMVSCFWFSIIEQLRRIHWLFTNVVGSLLRIEAVMGCVMQSISMLEGVHSALQHLYAHQQVLNEGAEIGKVGAVASDHVLLMSSLL